MTKFKIRLNQRKNLSPWITKGIKKSSKRKQKLCEKFKRKQELCESRKTKQKIKQTKKETQTHTHTHTHTHTQREEKENTIKFFCPTSISAKLNTQRFCYINDTKINC